MLDRFELLKLLQDGRFHSGEILAQQLGVTRGAVWKAIKKMAQDFELDIQSVRGRGYRLAMAVEFLDVDKIQAYLKSATDSQISSLEVHTSLSSTNHHVYERARQGVESGYVVIAEYQQAGRGRRGRSWVSPFAQNIYLSLLWRFDFGLARLSGLSLMVAVAVARALYRIAGVEPELKWPNDIQHHGRKLSGNLLEVQGESGGPCAVIIGIGVNTNMPTAVEDINQPWTDLSRASGRQVSRNLLSAAILDELVISLMTFAESGLKTFMADWQRWDVIRGKSVRLIFTDHEIEGQAEGVDEQGALLLRNRNGLHRYHMGEVSLRCAESRDQKFELI
ncbi:MAG TPA: bifunctional biotin--[acetyl-CoA-carboxylase] ligase/biotin operon repressor BirA [Gammaproteobacteria bacterium]|nr:bifunctional biotin--[acetyl-CoA-carboxylase] ligase/biotin operon repressor BirA [Gammaproteobacteria bacterium]